MPTEQGKQNHNAWKRDLGCLLNPRSIAVVGATEKVGPGRNTVYNLVNMNFEGVVYPINPKRDEVFGLKCYKSLSGLPEKPDLAVVSLPAAAVPEALRECERLGIKGAMVYTSGFAEVDATGAELQRELTEICERGEIRLCGPNCLGHLNVTKRTGAYSASLPVDMIPGKVAVVSQSGSMAIAMLQALKGLGMSQVISFGNQAVVELADYLSYLANDPDTGVITTFIEGVRDGRRFLEAAKECRRKGKAVVALKIGKSELSQKAISAHTAAMAGSDAVFEEALRECGVLQVGDIDEMLQTTTLLVKSKKARSRGVMLVTISGGQVGLIGDIASQFGVEFPSFAEKTVESLKPLIPPYLKIRNPLDVAGVGSDNYEDYANVLRACADDPAAGIVLVSQDAPAGVGPSTIDHYGKVARAVTEVYQEKEVPVVMFSNHSTPCNPEIVGDMTAAGVPYLQGTRESLLAVSRLMDYSFARETDEAPPVLKFSASWEHIEARFTELAKEKSFLGEKEGKELLSMLGIPAAEQVLCRNEAELPSIAGKIGYPLVLKVESPDIAHKTEAGGVVAGIESEEKLHSAWISMMKTVGERVPQARIEGATLQKMIPDGVDLIIGMHKDPQFGPVMVFGLGGIYVEVFKDSSLGLLPVTEQKARNMIRRSKVNALLGELRGRPALNEELLIDTILRVSEFVVRFEDRLSAIDINPIRIGTFGVCVLDALVLL